MPPIHQLRCLGAPTLYEPDGTAIRFRVKKHLALLAFLAMEPRTHRRDRLAELLWPAASEREGRHSLATALSVLRARLGRTAIDAGRDTVRLVPGSVELDLDRLAAGDVLGNDIVPVLAVAPLLEDFDVPDAPGWNQWKDAQSANWQPRIRDALLTLIDRSRRHGDTRTMERLADSLLAIDSLSEEGVRSKMESRAFAGDRLSALRIFEEWKDRLADDVGAQPGELIEGMAVRLRRRGWERTNKEHIAPVHTDQWKDRPFIGRGPQYRTLYEGWESTQQGAPRHVVITGDSGVGKSTLAARVATAAGLQGAVSAREQCHEVARDVPYTALGALVVGLLDKPGAGAIAPEWLGELGRAVSEVRRRFPHAPPPLEADGETARIRIADAFIELVNAVAEEQPVILILDDLHLADDASISVLHLLLRRLTSQRVLMLLTARPGEITAGGNAQKLLEWGDKIGATQVNVLPLTADEASDLLDSLLMSHSDRPTPLARRALLRAAAGYPMVMELLVHDWMAHGERCLALALEGMTEEAGAETGPGTMYRRILERLSADLDPATQNALNLAAVLGSRLNDFALYGLADLTIAQTMAGLSRLAGLRILRDSGQGLEFINELMRAQAYISVPSSVRRLLHGEVADRLVERVRLGERMLGLEIAWHCVRGGRKEESARYLISGADEAIENGAHVSAERALMTAVPNLEPAVRAQAQFRLAQVLQDQGRWMESQQVLDSIGDATQSPRREDRLALSTIANVMSAARKTEPFPEALVSLTRTIQGTSPPAIRLRAAAAAASYGVLTCDRTAESMTLGAIASISKQALSRSELAGLLLAQAQLAWPSRRYTECERLLDEAGSLVHGLPEGSPLMVRINLGRGMTLAAKGHFEKAVPYLDAAVSGGVRMGNDTAAGGALSGLAQCYIRLGNYESAIDSAQRSARLIGNHTAPNYLLASFYNEATGLAMLHEERDLRRTIERGDVIAREHSKTWIEQAWQLWSADALWLVGEADQALKRATTAMALCGSGLLNIGLAGPFCRWYSVLSTTVTPPPGMKHIFLEQIRDSQFRDAVDQAEIGLAAAVQANSGLISMRAAREAEALIPTHLPNTTWLLLKRLGLPPVATRSSCPASANYDAPT